MNADALEVQRTQMVIVTCPWCDGEVALDPLDAASLRCEGCSIEVELAREPAAIEAVAA